MVKKAKLKEMTVSEVQTSFVVELADQWVRSDDPVRRECGYGLLYEASKFSGRKAPGEEFFLAHVERIADTIGTESEKVRMSMGAALMGIGAVFGAILTMYTAVATRAGEIATLRALGFNAGAVLVSILAESLALAALGGLAGGLAAYLGFNGYQTSTINFQTFSQVAFAFRVTPALLALGLVWSLGMGLIGGLFPAVRAARLPISRALREL